MTDLVNVPVGLSKRDAMSLIAHHLERGEFALSPANVPSVLWRDAARSVALNAGVHLDRPRVDPETDQCLVRLNEGFPRRITPNTPEAHRWVASHPAWVADQVAYKRAGKGLEI